MDQVVQVRQRSLATLPVVTPRGGGRDRIVVSTLRCGRNNPGSNPGHGSVNAWTLLPVSLMSWWV